MCFPMESAVEKKWEYKGLQCIVTRADIGAAQRGRSEEPAWSLHRCGYVRIPPAHQWHGKNYDDIPADAHGGLTFAEIEPCAHEDGIGYWIGFDCIHGGDSRFPEGHAKHESESWLGRPAHYWTLEEVERETERLAEQVLAA